MKIGIDISQTVYNGTGVARYTVSLLKGLLQYDTKNEYVFFFSSLRQPVPVEVQKLLTEKVLLKRFKLPPSLLNMVWNKAHILPVEKLIGNVDVFLTSDWTEPPVEKAKKVTTIHDLVPYKFPETSQQETNFDVKTMNLKQNIVEIQKKRLEWVKEESDIITCNSNATKADVMEILDIDEKRLRVIYPGVEIEADERYKPEFEKKYSTDKPYILSVGTLQPRKNIQRLIQAFGAINIPNLELYIVGMQGWGTEVISNYKNVKFLGFVPDKDLPFLYKNAQFFIYPALYEGFGFPVVEAMKMGAAVATSNTSSLKELAEDVGYLFDPYSIKDIAQAIQILSNNEDFRKKLQQNSFNRAEHFTLKRFADGFINVFNELR